MSELANRLKAVVDQRYDGVARRASLAAGLHENAVLRVLENGPHLPNLETLDKMAQTYGWDLCDVVYWALNRPSPRSEEETAAHIIAAVLAREGYREVDRAFILDVVARCAPLRVPNSASS